MALERIGSRVWQHQDVLLAVGLAAVAVVEISAADTLTTRERLASVPLALAGTLALIWRRRAPVVVLRAVVGSVFLGWLVVPASGEDTIAVGIALVAAVYSVGAHASGAWAVAGVAVTLALVFVAVATDPDEATLGAYVLFLLVVGGP
ncbi:MAG TPA: hypothetical protein VD695_08635, partial [Gaiellaceae bacterium]|nr:hypothetical protein [Gaiellaceae bacterium]